MTSHDCYCGCLHKKLPANAKKTLNAFMASDQLSGATLALSVKDKEICGFSHSPSVFTVEITQRRGLSSDTHWFIWGWNEINFYVVRALSHRESEKWDGNTIVVIILIFFPPYRMWEPHRGSYHGNLLYHIICVGFCVAPPSLRCIHTHTTQTHTHTRTGTNGLKLKLIMEIAFISFTLSPSHASLFQSVTPLCFLITFPPFVSFIPPPTFHALFSLFSFPFHLLKSYFKSNLLNWDDRN